MKKCNCCGKWVTEDYVACIKADIFICFDCVEEIADYSDLYRKEKLKVKQLKHQLEIITKGEDNGTNI